MQAWIAGIIVSIMTQFTSWLLAKGLEIIHGKELQKTTDGDIDKKLLAFKLAYKEAFNGSPVTPEQREKLKGAISDFIRNAGAGL
jgi:hypothetical protein